MPPGHTHVVRIDPSGEVSLTKWEEALRLLPHGHGFYGRVTSHIVAAEVVTVPSIGGHVPKQRTSAPPPINPVATAWLRTRRCFKRATAYGAFFVLARGETNIYYDDFVRWLDEAAEPAALRERHDDRDGWVIGTDGSMVPGNTLLYTRYVDMQEVPCERMRLFAEVFDPAAPPGIAANPFVTRHQARLGYPGVVRGRCFAAPREGEDMEAVRRFFEDDGSDTDSEEYFVDFMEGWDGSPWARHAWEHIQ